MSQTPGAAAPSPKPTDLSADPPSLLFSPGSGRPVGSGSMPPSFVDLRLNQLVTLLFGSDEHNVVPVLFEPLGSLEAVGYRQEVFGELILPDVRTIATEFTEGVGRVRVRLATAARRRHRVQQDLGRVAAALDLVAVVETLDDALAARRPTSQGLAAVAAGVRRYRQSPAFSELRLGARAVQRRLAEVRYRVHIEGPRVSVGLTRDEPDYAAEVRRTFEQFTAGESSISVEPPIAFADSNLVEAAVIDRVALLFPAEFAALREFAAQQNPLIHATVADVERDLHFYLPFLDLMDRLAAVGLPMCLPVVTMGEPLELRDTFDLPLGAARAREGAGVVTNDVQLGDTERVLMLTGPNQGGKTTFARAIGQALTLAALGLPVPGSSARLPLVDTVGTHFPRAEDLSEMTGGLQDELLRAARVLEAASPRSALIVNEIFTSTSLSDAVVLSTRMLKRIESLGCLCVWVTFLDDVATVSDTIVCLVAQVDPADPSVRTFKLLRQQPNGRAYAMALARKHALTRDEIEARMAR